MSHVLLIETKPNPPFAIARHAAVRCGHRVTLVTSDLGVYLKAPSADGDLRFVSRILEVPDTCDAERLWPVIERLHAEDPIDAILTLSDLHVVPTAELALRLGLRFARPEAVRQTRNKLRTRQALERAGVPQPRFSFATTAAAARRAAEMIGYPVIVKPVDGISSLNAAIARNGDEVEQAAARIIAYCDYGRSAASERTMLVEEYVEGPLFSCETFSAGGQHRVIGVADKILSRPPAVAELGGSFPADFPERAELEAVCKAALDAVGFDFGAAHTELILSSRGPIIVEINGRLVGGVVPEMIDAALGSCIYLDLVRLHLGEDDLEVIALAERPAGSATIRAFYSTVPGRLSRLDASPHHADPDVVLHVLTCKAGDRVAELRDNTGRLGFVITKGKNAEDSSALAARIFDTTILDIA